MDLIFCGSGWLPVVDAIAERLEEDDTIRIWDRAIPLSEAVADAHVILPSNAAITADVIAAAPSLVLIQQPAAGVDAIDVDAANAKGVPVCNAPGGNHVAVAEAALLLMLALARRYRVAQSCFEQRSIGVPLGIELSGRHLGIVGKGRSGGALAERASAMAMTVHSVGSGNTRAELEDMLSRCDVVSIHAPLNSRTRNLFDDAAFAAMKPGALLINCARGPLIDRAALSRALETGRLGGVGLDVFWEEPWDPNDPLFARPDVVVLPHIAGSTHESFARIADIVADNVRRVRRGEPVHYRVDG